MEGERRVRRGKKKEGERRVKRGFLSACFTSAHFFDKILILPMKVEFRLLYC